MSSFQRRKDSKGVVVEGHERLSVGPVCLYGGATKLSHCTRLSLIRFLLPTGMSNKNVSSEEQGDPVDSWSHLVPLDRQTKLLPLGLGGAMRLGSACSLFPITVQTTLCLHPNTIHLGPEPMSCSYRRSFGPSSSNVSSHATSSTSAKYSHVLPYPHDRL